VRNIQTNHTKADYLRFFKKEKNAAGYWRMEGSYNCIHADRVVIEVGKSADCSPKLREEALLISVIANPTRNF
jgi:aminopeptidase-like protein